MSSIAGNQARTFLALLGAIRSDIRRDRNLPARIQQSITKEKRFGSRDRRLYRELLYTAVRFWSWFEEIEARSEDGAVAAIIWMAADTIAMAPLKASLGSRFPVLPAAMEDRARILGVTDSLVPDWVKDECPAASVSPELDALHRRAPLWLRVDPGAITDVLREFETLGWSYRQSNLSADAIELLGDIDATKTGSFGKGRFEIQDLGSQLVLQTIPLAPSTRWLDACAGAGGKTLQLAQMVGPRGRVVAHDIRSAALDELSLRAQRSRLANIDVTLEPKGEFDGVLVDAPCSGSGTWRRSPHLKWVTTADNIRESAGLQRKLLSEYARHVRPGGLLVYATCSLCRSENAATVRAFLQENPAFALRAPERPFTGKVVSEGVQLWPAGHDGDGFFVAIMQRS
ncbi:MAG TPA: RsmB/NOP family class I SAM-dependent RNA methyltransferase [Opitutaceae bacterium]|nr:RsmB/NOP family class I SAM-dependent RNA methyltransferase [Opitutaceae bacterium]